MCVKANKETKSNSMKKSKNKQNNPNLMNLIMKIDIECFCYNNLLQD